MNNINAKRVGILKYNSNKDSYSLKIIGTGF